MLALVVAALLAAAPATPAAPPSTASVAAGALVRAANAVPRKGLTDEQRASLAALEKQLRDPAVTAVAVASAADALGAMAPDDELTHVFVLDALMQLAAGEHETAALRQRIRTRATEFTQRNAWSARGWDVLATALLQQGDEEGQLRALASCTVLAVERASFGRGVCKARFDEAQRRWQRVRCAGDLVPRGLSLRMGKDELANAADVAFIEPVPGAPATATTPEVPATCVLQLAPVASGRLVSRLGADAQTLFLLNGITLVTDVFPRVDPVKGVLVVGAAECARICPKPQPRPLPPNLVPEPPPAPGAAP